MGEIRISTKLEDLGIQLEEISREISDQLTLATAQLAQLTYNHAVSLATQRLDTTKQQYLDALKFETESEGVFVIYLEEPAEHLEKGYPPYPMIQKILNGGKKAKVSKEGYRYKVIPLRQRTDTAAVQPSSNAKSLALRIQEVIDNRKFKRVKSSVDQKTGKMTTVDRYTGSAAHPFLKGLTRVREYQSARHWEPSSSAYLTFRVVSEKQIGKGKWNHPGFQGANVFPDIERWADSQLDNILKDIFGR